PYAFTLQPPPSPPTPFPYPTLFRSDRDHRASLRRELGKVGPRQFEFDLGSVLRAASAHFHADLFNRVEISRAQTKSRHQFRPFEAGPVTVDGTRPPRRVAKVRAASRVEIPLDTITLPQSVVRRLIGRFLVER